MFLLKPALCLDGAGKLVVMEFGAQILEHCGLDSPHAAFAGSWLLPLEQGVEPALADALEPHKKM